MPCSSLERRCSEADAFEHLLGSPRACILEQLKSPSVSDCTHTSSTSQGMCQCIAGASSLLGWRMLGSCSWQVVSPRCCFVPQAVSAGGGLKLAEQAAPKVPDVATMAKVRGSWHLAAVKKPAAAAVLMDLKVQRIGHGEYCYRSADVEQPVLVVLYVLKHGAQDGFAWISAAEAVWAGPAWRYLAVPPTGAPRSSSGSRAGAQPAWISMLMSSRSLTIPVLLCCCRWP
jgi:hypothetical protein